jgi:hypothetical protein
MHTARHVFLISAPPLLRLLSLISTVCNATAFSQARRVHEHPCSRLFWGQAETTRPTKSGMTGRCHCCRPNCWFIGDVALTKVLKRNTFVGRHRQQGQLCHNSSCSQHSLVPMSPSCSVGGAAAAAPALPFAVQVLRTTNESADIGCMGEHT